MGKYLIGGLIGLVLGVAGTFMIMGSAVGAGAGAGVAVGLTTGICTMAKSAQDMGLMTPEQVDQVLSNALTLFGETADVPEGAEVVGSAAQCEEALAKIRAAAAK